MMSKHNVNFREYLEIDESKKHLSVTKRLVLLPFSFILWFGQFLLFTCALGIVAVGSALICLIVYGFDPGRNLLTFIIEFGLAPIVFPFLWWYRYFRFGEYGMIRDWCDKLEPL